MKTLFPIFMAVAAYTCLSAGLVLMKKGVDWIGWKGKRDGTYFRSLLIWITGLLVMNIYGIPSAMALKTLPAHIVGGFAGWGIVVMVFLSAFLLHERIYISDFIYSIMVIAGIALLNFCNTSPPSGSGQISGTIILFVIPFMLFVLSLYFPGTDKFRALVFATVSGLSAGSMVVALQFLVQLYRYQIGLYFRSPFLYLYAGLALLSLVALQLALKKGEMIIIGPVQYSTQIGYPLLAAWLVFRHPIQPIQYFSILLIILSVVGILRKH